MLPFVSCEKNKNENKNIARHEKVLLLKQIDETDFSVLEAGKNGGQNSKRGKITPLAAMQLKEIHQKEEKFRATGLQAIREGKVGAVLLAGGMGTRLGSDNPKGMFNIGITKEVYIFQRLIENLMEVVKEAGARWGWWSCSSSGEWRTWCRCW